MDLTVFSLSELQELGRKVADELRSWERAEITKAREQVLAIARNAGILLGELVGSANKPEKAQVATQYQNPENAGQQWSGRGRGRQPGWVNDWLAAGKPMDSLRIV